MNKHLFLYSIIVLAIVSCTERIDLDLNNGEFRRLVVEGWITDQTKAHEVRLSWTSSYYANEQAQAASGAIVSINDGQNSFDLTEQPSGSGLYYTDPTVAGSIGNTYTLNIELEGANWIASDIMREVPAVDSVALEYVDGDQDDDPYYDLLLWTVELPGIGDHYRWNVLINGENIRDTLSDISFSDDLLYDGAELDGVAIDYFDADRVVPGDTITLEQHAITEQAYDVIIAVLSETSWRGGLFDPPPANVPSNVSNGGLGFFGAASVSDGYTLVP